MDVFLAIFAQMWVVLYFLAALLAAALIHGLWVKLRSLARPMLSGVLRRLNFPRLNFPRLNFPRLNFIAARPRTKAQSDDPRVAVAALLVVVATGTGNRLTRDQQAQIEAMLTDTLGLAPDMARDCFIHGQRRAAMTAKSGRDITARLHQLIAPIERSCSRQEKQDVIDMLGKIAGPSFQRVGGVRDGIGRLAATLLPST
jgi:uncharacterized tellurite resistance protein B-like protein